MSLWHIAIPFALGLNACSAGSVAAHPQVHVAAASNLGRTLGVLARAFEAGTGIAVAPRLGTTAMPVPASNARASAPKVLPRLDAAAT